MIRPDIEQTMAAQPVLIIALSKNTVAAVESGSTTWVALLASWPQAMVYLRLAHNLGRPTTAEFYGSCRPLQLDNSPLRYSTIDDRQRGKQLSSEAPITQLYAESGCGRSRVAITWKRRGVA